jgi:hypothetical protein
MHRVFSGAVGFVCALMMVGLLFGTAACNNSGPEEAPPPAPPTVDRTVEGALMARVESLHEAMPDEGSDGFVPPTDADLRHWRALVDTLAAADTAAARTLIAEHAPSYALIQFTDTTTQETYFVLQEAPTVTKCWGAVVVNPTPERNLAVQVPHPQFDLNTYREGAALFRDTRARVLLMAGTHRCANQAASPCDGETGVCGARKPYRQSDAAHVTAAPFQVTHEAFVDRYPELTALSLHGNGQEECETVFLTSGVEDDTPAPVEDLRQALVERGVRAGVPGTSSCPLVGSTNVQGRYTNGVGAPCTEAAGAATGTFIHVEQRLDFRQSPDRYQALIDAVNATF